MLNRVSAPLISDEFFERLKAAFPAMKVYPGVDKDKLMFNAGALDVIEWIDAKRAKG